MIRINLALDSVNKMMGSCLIYYFTKGEAIGYAKNPVECAPGMKRCDYVRKKMEERKRG